jgi:hypothetical protein
MDVTIDGKLLRLRQQHVIGAGGEGTVFLATVAGQQLAVKIYHNPTIQRQEKLRSLLSRQWSVPRSRVAFPLRAAYDTRRGSVTGFSMPYMGSGFEELARLANKKHRASFLISTRDVVSIFLDGAASLATIHQSGLVVGDFSDQNVLYKDAAMLWIDVDAWQFSSYPCPVGTEDFLAPELYGIDLSQKPVFQIEHDWYSFAVHLFRSLLLAHPYGGTHKTVPLLTQRAWQKIFVLDPSVIYPKIAHSPDLLSDELLDVFERIFARGWRGQFPIEALHRYYDSLVECSSCKMYYPRNRLTCSLCNAKTIMIVQPPLVSVTGVSITELMRTNGKIVFAKVQGQAIYVVAYEDGSAVLYNCVPGVAPRRAELFKEIPGARYDLLGDTLIVNLPQTTQLLFIDVSGSKPRALFQAETALFAGNRRAMLRASNTHVFYILNNALMFAAIEDGTLKGRPLRTVMEKQTWFTVAPDTGDGKPTVFGFFQVFRQQMYWLIRGHAVYDVALPPLNAEESLLDIAVRFSTSDALIRRHTQEQGTDYLRTEMIDNAGNIVYSSPRIRRADHPCPGIHGQAYAAGVLLHASDNGIVQEKIEQGTFKTFTATAGIVQEGDMLIKYQSGLIVVGEDRASYLVL